MKITDLIKNLNETIQVGDHFDIELDDLVIESVVIDIADDSILIECDDNVLSYLMVEDISDDEKRKFGLTRPRHLINPSPRKIDKDGPDTPDNYEYTKFIPRGHDRKTAWAVERDVIDSNFKKIAEFYRLGKFSSIKSMLGLLTNIADRLANRENGAEEAAEIKNRIANWEEKLARAAERGRGKSKKAVASPGTSVMGVNYLNPANRPPRNRPYEDASQASESTVLGAWAASAPEALKDPRAKEIIYRYGHYTAGDYKREFGLSDEQAKFAERLSMDVFVPSPDRDQKRGMLVSYVLNVLMKDKNNSLDEAKYKVGDTVSYKHDGMETHGFKITAIRGDNLELHKKPFDPAEPEIRTTAHISKVWVDEGERVEEAKYQGRTVPLGKPMAGDVKKRKVYVKKPNGKVVKVNFGDKKMRIKKSNPKRRKSFRARHNCKNPGPRWRARYWSCRAW